MKIILASASQNRKEGMKIAAIPVTVMPAEVDEKSIAEPDLPQRAIAIARLKAQWVQTQLAQAASPSDSIIIAGDGFNEVNGAIFEKPQTVTEGRSMLEQLSNHQTTFHSGLVMINTSTDEQFEAVVSATAWFRELGAAEIEDYLQSIDVTQYAAAYTPLNSKAISFITHIEGSLSGFSHSLPLDLIVPKLREWGAL